MSTETEPPTDLESKISKSQLTDKESSIVEYWSNNPGATLSTIGSEANSTAATAARTIKLYGWLYDESQWLDRDWEGNPREVKLEAISNKSNVTGLVTKPSTNEQENNIEETDTKSRKQKQQNNTRNDNTQSTGPPIEEIGGIDGLISNIKQCSTIEDWSILLNEYINWGNNSMVGNSVAIFNLGAAHDCPNRFTANCQVGGDECYAVVDEKRYEHALDFYRRQEYLWDCMDAETWAKAFIIILERKQSEATALKFNQAGDFRCEGDIFKVNHIAERLSDFDVSVFTYSASNYLDWSYADSDNLTVNQSNSLEEYGDRRFHAVDSPNEIPEDAVWCLYDRQKMNGVDLNDRIKCGECKICIDDKSGDVAAIK